jgi:glycolate oxidase iron-sulfur subunit
VVLATRDISEVITAEAEALARSAEGLPAAAGKRAPAGLPEPLQPAARAQDSRHVESLLTAAGYTLTPVADSHLCCGSAGTYSVLQPEISKRLQANKLARTHGRAPAAIASANVGCMGHLQGGTDVPVRHWIELIDERLSA